MRPYGESEMVQIADTAVEFVAACEAAMNEDAAARLHEVDAFLAQTSWDRTWRRMSDLIEDVVTARKTSAVTAQPALAKATAASATRSQSFMSGD